MSFDAIAAQPRAIEILKSGLEQDRVSHAYLFVGPSGVGKTMAALALARAAICPEQPGRGCGGCETCRRIDDGNHPDVRLIAPRDEGNRNLPVEMIRNDILPFSKFAPFEASRAFLIFPQADISFPVQHAEAANALLKTLEEPRANLHFVLTSERPERLLTTIRSRCQRVRFRPLPADVLHRILSDHAIEEEVRSSAVALCGGRADVALSLCAEDRAKHTLDMAVRIDEAVEGGHGGPLLDLAEELARSDDRAIVLECLSLLYRDVAAAALGLPDERLTLSHRAGLVRKRAERLTASEAATRVARIAQLSEDLAMNANPEVALDGLLLSL